MRQYQHSGTSAWVSKKIGVISMSQAFLGLSQSAQQPGQHCF